jgi:GTP diphosphokinase / guanosine-3',5'-bis(diphosphate) 3'-diphosphatase
VREVVRAYRYAEAMHEGQKRRAARPTSPTRSRSRPSSPSSGSGPRRWSRRCCTTPSRTPRPPSTTSAEGFGEEVAHLVDGVTKLDRIQVESKQQQQAETLRKMIVAMAKDIRVLVIKLADRLHNMETIGYMPREKQKRIAQETLDIYAPLAHRLGMQNFKLRLEDLGFKTLHPKRYEEIVAMVEERNPEREATSSRSSPRSTTSSAS